MWTRVELTCFPIVLILVCLLTDSYQTPASPSYRDYDYSETSRLVQNAPSIPQVQDYWTFVDQQVRSLPLDGTKQNLATALINMRRAKGGEGSQLQRFVEVSNEILKSILDASTYSYVRTRWTNVERARKKQLEKPDNTAGTTRGPGRPSTMKWRKIEYRDPLEVDDDNLSLQAIFAQVPDPVLLPRWADRAEALLRHQKKIDEHPSMKWLRSVRREALPYTVVNFIHGQGLQGIDLRDFRSELIRQLTSKLGEGVRQGLQDAWKKGQKWKHTHIPYHGTPEHSNEEIREAHESRKNESQGARLRRRREQSAAVQVATATVPSEGFSEGSEQQEQCPSSQASYSEASGRSDMMIPSSSHRSNQSSSLSVLEHGPDIDPHLSLSQWPSGSLWELQSGQWHDNTALQLNRSTRSDINDGFHANTHGTVYDDESTAQPSAPEHHYGQADRRNLDSYANPVASQIVHTHALAYQTHSDHNEHAQRDPILSHNFQQMSPMHPHSQPQSLLLYASDDEQQVQPSPPSPAYWNYEQPPWDLP